jgi:hypothetical protein
MVAAPVRQALPERLLAGLAALTLAGTTIGAAAGLVRAAILFPSLAGMLCAAAGLLLAAVLILAAARASMWRAGALLIAAALALRLWAWLAIGDLSQVHVGNDYDAYQMLAGNVLQGRGLLARTQHYGTVAGMYPPLYPLLLAGARALAGPDSAAFLLDSLVDLGAAALIVAIGRRLGEARAGLIAAGLYFVWPTFVLEAPLAHKEGLMILLTLAMALAVLRARQSGPGWASAGGFGLAAALLALTQPALALLAPLFALLLLPSPGWRAMAGFALKALPFWLAAMAPWWLRNWLLFGTFVPLTTSGGASLLVAAIGRHLTLGKELLAQSEPARSSILAQQAVGIIAADPLGFVVGRATAIIRSLSIEDNIASRLTQFAPPVPWANAMLPLTQAAHLAAVALALPETWRATRPAAHMLALLAGLSLLQILLVQPWLEMGERHTQFMTPFVLLLAALTLSRRLAKR